MDTKEKAAWLADLYQHVAVGGKLEFNYTDLGWRVHERFPDWYSETTVWRKKPMVQVVDLTCLIESGIDCEFSNAEISRAIGTLTGASKGVHAYERSNIGFYSFCKPRQDHIHAWQGGECPLPTGVMVRVWLRDGGSETHIAVEYVWDWSQVCPEADIIAFEVLGLADGYVWPWEVES